MMVDQDRQQRGRYGVYRFAAFAMIRNLGDSLAGRISLLELLPFSVTEKTTGD